MTSQELLELKDDCDAIEIPSGRPHRIPAGTRLRLLQRLDSYTVATELGDMLRIDGKDAEALGVIPPQTAEAPAGAHSARN